MKASEFRQILGIRFYVGDLDGLLDLAMKGGLIVVPSAPVLADLSKDTAHREAIERSDIAVTDSGFMVLLWALMEREWIHRISGLRFLRGLLERPEFRQPGASFWIMPGEADGAHNRTWLRENGCPVEAADCFVAPQYPKGKLEDFELLARIEERKPQFVLINVGGGVQERLGYFLRTRLSYQPAIICTGAAIAFLSGKQTRIPVWADRFVLGWLLRSMGQPTRFVPRYVKSLKAAPLLWRQRSRSLVPMENPFIPDET